MKILFINTFDPNLEVHGGATVIRKELELVKKIGDVTTLFSRPLKKRVFDINPFRLIFDVIFGKSIKQSSYSVLHRSPEYYMEFDLIYCNHDFSAYDYSSFIELNIPFIIRKLNSEHLFYSEDKFFQKIERARILKFEKELARSARCVIHISSTEFLNDDYSKNKNILFPPLISDDLLRSPLSLTPYLHSSRSIDILCVTNYEWKPNREGFDWFFAQVAPRLAKRFNIHLVGIGSDRYAGFPCVTSHGFIEDVSIFYKSSKIFISPIISGAGIKIKNLEAMIYGVPVVSTPIGVDGLTDLASLGGVTVAETSERFADLLHAMLMDEERCRKQQMVAESWIRSNVYGPEEWRARLGHIFDQAVNNNSVASV
jgi:glycosyltransferase involved in cell wall biosynthesis